MIFETIVTTINTDGSPHLAPFGMREADGAIIIAPFKPSATLDNVLRSHCAVVNCTDDVRVFAGCLTGHHHWPVRRAEVVDGWVLDAALAHREVRLVSVQEDAIRPELVLQVVHEQIHAPFRGFNRAQAAVIEAAVLVSRLHLLPAEKIDAELNYLAIAVEKTAGEWEWQAWNWLMEKIENFRVEQTGGNQA
jgi:hypothetical protein